MPIQTVRSGATPAASVTRIPTPTAPRKAAPPPAAAPALAPAPAPAPKKDELGITEAWADDPELPPPAPNRVSEPIKRVSQSVQVAPEPPKPEPVGPPKEKEEVRLGVTQVFERPTPTPTPQLAIVASKTPSPSAAAVDWVDHPATPERKPRIGFGNNPDGAKGRMIGIAVAAVAACLVIGAIVVLPRMGHSAPPAVAAKVPAASTPVASAPAAAAPAPAQIASAAASPTPAAETPVPAQTKEAFSEHMGPATPPPAAEEPDSNTDRVRPTPRSAPIKLSRGAPTPAVPEVGLPSAPTVDLEKATKAIDSTTKKKKPDSIAVPSF
jgi:hypothetical protein